MENNIYLLSFLENLLYPLIIGVLVSVAVTYYVNKKLDEYKHKNSKELQVESYFREISGKKLEENFNHWLNSLLDPDTFAKKMRNKVEVSKQLKSTFMYGSNKTVLIASLVMQQIYYNNMIEEKISKGEVSDDEKSEKDVWILYMLVANLLCSLKYDYTGYEVDPMTLVKFKINDFSEPDTARKFYEGKKLADKKIQESL